MSIASKLTELDADIINAYDAIEDMGGTVPQNKNTNNLDTAIRSIPTTPPTPEYVELEYIESSGTQYINTEIKPTHHYIEIEAQYTNNSNNQCLFGCDPNDYNLTWYNNKWYFSNGYGQNYGGEQYLCTNLNVFEYGKNNQFIINYNVINSNINPASSLDLYIFNRSSVMENGAPAKVYYCKIYDKLTDTLVRDFIPVKDNNNIACMYDKVTETFFYNQGTGNFIAGSEKIVEVVEKDVNFYDYDGTLVNSYTKNEFLALTEMPANPSHTGLTAQGWNWTLADAKTYVTDYGILDIGQMYVTDDNKTRIYIRLQEGRLAPYLGFAVDGSVTVNWGDGNSQTVTGSDTSTVIYTQHNYSNAGDYIITLQSSSTIYLSGTTDGCYLLTKNNSTQPNENRVYQNSIQKIELSSNISIEADAFYYCYSLQSITIPNSVTSIGNHAFDHCYSLQSITIPSGVTSIENSAFNSCYSLQSIIIPSGVTSIENNTFNYCYSLQSITIPSGVTSIGNSAFSSCYSLQSITIPSGVTSIGNSAFNYCSSLQSITIPSGVTSIGNSTFTYCYGMGYYDFSNYISVPTLANTNAFTRIPSDCKIVVPDDLYNDWIAASKWSTYANRIIKASEA